MVGIVGYGVVLEGIDVSSVKLRFEKLGSSGRRGLQGFRRIHSELDWLFEGAHKNI